ncbi:hypothetical protein QVD17_33236 [Tagetes erecta]|uniref:Cytochrome P450 n=1 Tax=Tagetes erecta TaxID=13708 RepID=A0AAD8K0R9_TARER|nr:hypothetical protein QVD17_33236 [Tagetes erecta]
MLLHFGSVPTLVVSTAKAAQEIMKTHDASTCSKPNLPIPNILFYNCKGVAFSPYGERWRQLKSIMVLKLLSNTRVKSYQKVREDEVVRMIHMLGESHGATIDMGSVFSSVANNIICRVAIGKKLDGVKHITMLRKFMELLVLFSVGNFFPWLSWVDRIVGSVGRAEKLAKEVDEFLEGIVEERINKNKGEDEDDDESDKLGEDFLDILLDVQKNNTTGFTLDRDSLKVILLEAIIGGTHTTNTSLEWAISEIIRNPRVMKKLQKEITEATQGRSMIFEEDLDKMPYLKAVIKESLRLHTLAPLLPRKTTQDITLMGYNIAAGTQVIINAWAIGRDPNSWDEPNDFRPERFLNSTMNYQGLQYEWLTFGSGRRMCPGIQFSAALLELLLANIIYKFDITLPNGIKNEDLDMSETNGITTDKKSRLLVLLSPRF